MSDTLRLSHYRVTRPAQETRCARTGCACSIRIGDLAALEPSSGRVYCGPTCARPPVRSVRVAPVRPPVLPFAAPRPVSVRS